MFSMAHFGIFIATYMANLQRAFIKNNLLIRATLTSDSDGIHISQSENVVSRQVQVNSATVAVVLRNVFSHCQHAGAGGLGQVVSILDLNSGITGELCQTCCIRTISAPPSKPLGKGHIPHTLNTTGGSAGEGEGVVGSHIGETSGVGSESDSQDWDCIVRGENRAPCLSNTCLMV